MPLWRSQELSVAEVITRLAERWSGAEVEAAAWKLVADAAAQGRLAVDLASVPLSRAIPIRFLDPEAPPILSAPLPDLLPLPLVLVAGQRAQEEVEDTPIDEQMRGLAGPAVDAG